MRADGRQIGAIGSLLDDRFGGFPCRVCAFEKRRRFRVQQILSGLGIMEWLITSRAVRLLAHRGVRFGIVWCLGASLAARSQDEHATLADTMFGYRLH